MNIKRHTAPVLTILLLSLTLSGCVGVLLGGAAVGTKSAVDRRTTGAQTDDNVMAVRVETTARSYLRQNNQAQGYTPKLTSSATTATCCCSDKLPLKAKNNSSNKSPAPSKPPKACTTTSPLPPKNAHSAT